MIQVKLKVMKTDLLFSLEMVGCGEHQIRREYSSQMLTYPCVEDIQGVEPTLCPSVDEQINSVHIHSGTCSAVRKMKS